LGDFGVRKYDSDLGMFTSIDPLWEKYYGWSPYHYCGNDPVNAVDPEGLLKRDPNTNKVIFEHSHYQTDVIRGYNIRFEYGYATTDDGNYKILMSKIVRTNSSEEGKKIEDGFEQNCIGFTFADGEFWIQPNQVEKILIGDNYKLTVAPVVGGIATYDEDPQIIEGLKKIGKLGKDEPGADNYGHVAKIVRKNNQVLENSISGQKTTPYIAPIGEVTDNINIYKKQILYFYQPKGNK